MTAGGDITAIQSRAKTVRRATPSKKDAANGMGDAMRARWAADPSRLFAAVLDGQNGLATPRNATLAIPTQ